MQAMCMIGLTLFHSCSGVALPIPYIRKAEKLSQDFRADGRVSDNVLVVSVTPSPVSVHHPLAGCYQLVPVRAYHITFAGCSCHRRHALISLHLLPYRSHRDLHSCRSSRACCRSTI